MPSKTRVTFVLGDITLQQVDVIVNAANSSLLGGGGVDGAIHRAGGPEILAACRRLRETDYPHGLPTGGAVATAAGNLLARHVIHVVGPVHARDRDHAALLRSCYVEAVRLAESLGARTIAFPSISTGAFGYPVDEAAPIAIGAVLDTPSALDEARFVLFSPGDKQAYERAHARLAAG
jgi:O-acetyl-ADP-ribose deacetylase (regulator of RNase III)